MIDPRKKHRRASDKESANGVIDLRRDFVLHTKKDEESFNTLHSSMEGIATTLRDYVRDDAKWKEDNKEALDNMKNLSKSWKIFLSACLAITVIGGAVFTIKKVLNL